MERPLRAQSHQGGVGPNGYEETEAQRGVEESRAARVGDSSGKLDYKGNVTAGWRASGVRRDKE